MGRKKHKIKFRSNYGNRKVNYGWLLGITVATFGLATLFGYISLILTEKLDLVIAIIIVFVIVLIGVFFDGLGIAVTAADETPFHSMAAKKVIGAKESILLIRNAGVVANFFNDVIGDIAGIISGAATGAIVLKINEQISINTILWGMILSAVAAALTVGGKAVGKEIALRKSNYIVYKLGILLNFCTSFIELFWRKKM